MFWLQESDRTPENKFKLQRHYEESNLPDQETDYK